MISGPLYSSFISCQEIKSNPAVMILFHFSKQALSFQEYKEWRRGKSTLGELFISEYFSSGKLFYIFSPPNLYRCIIHNYSFSGVGEHPAYIVSVL
jgi:hypothetical protein